jgi:hypothetical protein
MNALPWPEAVWVCRGTAGGMACDRETAYGPVLAITLL